MNSFDFDLETQKIFDKEFSDIPSSNWQKWLEIDSREEYEELSLKLSGLSSIEDIFSKIESEITDSRSFSIDLEDFLKKDQGSDSPIFCHTSGTTNSKLSMLKWFYMARDIVKRQWAPGMQAIFESSGLDPKSSAIIFVPSRLKFDGIRSYEEKKYVSLYSSEFSQRIMLSVIKPKSYLFFEYKNSRNLEVISKILAMENISAISAPAITILGWADITRLQEGLKKSLNLTSETQNPILEQFILNIRKNGLENAAKEIQSKLSEKFSNATLVFSISSLSKSDWELIRKFMQWEQDKERFTNLYVASEVGPFAASIKKDPFGIANSNTMYIFPLTLPVIEYNGRKELISRTKNKIGRLYISRLNNSAPLINIDIRDVISIKNQDGLPQIDGKILRSSFKLMYPIKLSNEIVLKSDYEVYAGDFFIFPNFEIKNPRLLLNCLKENCAFEIDSLLLIKRKESLKNDFKLFLYSNNKTDCSNLKNYSEILIKCIRSEKFKEAILNHDIELELINNNPVDFLATHSKMLEKVRNGKNPKGVLKKWPLYVVQV
ncbi:MAG: hypothetical protein JSV62_09645 [Promethearchaeota archaeon]|nr:MAG: hypothetical protein JSV62_09645 [Candidatus Lokiarchaeota archaeon]